MVRSPDYSTHPHVVALILALRSALVRNLAIHLAICGKSLFVAYAVGCSTFGSLRALSSAYKIEYTIRQMASSTEGPTGVPASHLDPFDLGLGEGTNHCAISLKWSNGPQRITSGSRLCAPRRCTRGDPQRFSSLSKRMARRGGEQVPVSRTSVAVEQTRLSPLDIESLRARSTFRVQQPPVHWSSFTDLCAS